MAEHRDLGEERQGRRASGCGDCILVGRLELNVSTSLVDDEGVDLVFHGRERSATLAVQIKSRSLNAKAIADRSRFVANVGASTFRPREDFYMLFVAVNTDEGTFNPVWLVPSVAFAQRTKPNNKNGRQFVSSMKPDTKDQWHGFRHERTELPGRILDALDSLGAA